MFFCFNWDHFVLVLFAFIVFAIGLVSSVRCQEIGKEEHLRNNLLCVEWDKKNLKSILQCRSQMSITKNSSVIVQSCTISQPRSLLEPILVQKVKQEQKGAPTTADLETPSSFHESVYIGLQWRNFFIPYLCQLFFFAMMWGKLWEMMLLWHHFRSK